MLNQHARRQGFWRRVIAGVIAYAVAAQSVLIVIGAFGLAARADQAPSGFELCHHDAQDSPATPALPGSSGDPACSHCLFCFAGPQQALTGSPALLFHRVNVAIVNFLPAVDDPHIPHRSPYSIANPRGPPLPT